MVWTRKGDLRGPRGPQGTPGLPGNDPRIGETPSTQGLGFAVVDSFGAASWLSTDLSGGIPPHSARMMQTALGASTESQTKSRTDMLAAYGDSLTEAGQGGGSTWETTLQALRGYGTVANRGSSGQTSGTVAIRQGGVKLALTAAVTIPADTTPVDVAFQSSVTPLNNRTDVANTVAGSIAGVPGQLKITARTATTGAVSGTFTPTGTRGATTTAAAGTVLVPLYGPADQESVQMLWVGRNDVAFAGDTTVSGVLAAVQAMAAYLLGAVDLPRFLVLSVTTSQSETSGSYGHTTVRSINSALQSAFPRNYIDVLTEIKTNGLAKTGITPTADDQTALAGDTIPPSLTVDGLHFNEACRTKVIAPFVARHLAIRGWI